MGLGGMDLAIVIGPAIGLGLGKGFGAGGVGIFGVLAADLRFPLTACTTGLFVDCVG